MSPTGSEDSVTSGQSPVEPETTQNESGLARESEAHSTSMCSSGDGQMSEHSETPEEHRVPDGNYRLVSWDLDTTGRLLLDEICHIGAYCAKIDSETKHFSQYVMPFRNPNPGAVRRHHLRVISTDRYRMLKDLKTGKMLRTKSEITAITDFLDWLEKAKGDADGIVLVAYETRDVNAMLLLQAVEKYKLMDQFENTVKGFVNGYDVASRRCGRTFRSLTLRTLTKVLLNDENDERMDNASLRSQLILDVLERVVETTEPPLVYNDIKDSAVAVSGELCALNRMRQTLRKQGGLRPIFEAQLRQGIRARQKMTYFRRLLAEADLDYTNLKSAHENGDDMLQNVLKSKLNQLKPKDIDELVALMDKHFQLGDDQKVKKEPKVEKEPKIEKEPKLETV